MPISLRGRAAILLLLGAFLVPLGMSSLRGLTHVLTCRERAATPFTIIIPEFGPPQLSSSTRIERGVTGLCGGLHLDLRAGPGDDENILMVVRITNGTDSPWRGTVALELPREGTSAPVNIGSIEPGETAEDILQLRLDKGSHQVDGSLLIGP